MSAALAMMLLTADEVEVLSDLAELRGLLFVSSPADEGWWLPLTPANDWALAAIRNLRAAAEARA